MTNFGVILGVMLCLLLGAALPDPKTEPQKADDCTFWIYMNILPGGVALTNLILWLFIFKYESVKTYLTMCTAAQSSAEIGISDSATSKEGLA